ncbi:MAG: cyclic-di-AMP receptor [Herpetosiphon sp.]
MAQSSTGNRHDPQADPSIPGMKLGLFVVDNSRADRTVDHLVQNGLRVTRLSSTGGFLRRGNTTLLIGAHEADLQRASVLVREIAPGTVMITLDLERYEHL